MKLYFSPGACSLSPHIVLHEAGLRFDLEKVVLSTKLTESGADYRKINPKGYVPALQLDNGEVLTEGPAIVQYLADLVPQMQLAPAAGTLERYRLVEWLNFISTEVHKGFSPLFRPTTPEQTKQAALTTLATRFDYLAGHLEDREFLVGRRFTVADAYLFTVLNWTGYVKVELDRWPALQAYKERMAARPAVRAAMHEEGLLKS